MRSWIYRIAFNQALNLKGRVRYRSPHVGEQALAGLAAPNRDPLAGLQDARRDRALEECMFELLIAVAVAVPFAIVAAVQRRDFRRVS